MAEQKLMDAGTAEVTDQELNELTSEAIQIMGASSSYRLEPRDQTGDTTLFGEYRIDNQNQFKRYTQLSLITPHTFIPLAKLGLSIVSGFRLDSIDDNKSTLEEIEEWATKIDLRNTIQNIARCTIRDGTVVANIPTKPDTGIETIHILPMEYTTLLPAGIEPGQTVTTLIKGDVEKAVMMESEINKDNRVVMEREEFALFRLFHEGYFTTDILSRETYGIYGISMLEPLTRTIKNLSDLTEGYSSNMRRYGTGRLHIDIPLVEKLRAEGKKEEAKKVLEAAIASFQTLKKNEDVISGGANVSTIAGTTAPGVKEMKQSYEMDIHVGLLQSGVSMGDTKGSTYASGYLAEEDRFIILESIQEYIRETTQKEIMDKQLVLLGHEPGAVEIKVDKLDVPYVEYNTLTDAVMNGYISEEEYRLALGFPEKKPEEA